MSDLQKQAAERIADFANQEISALGLPKEEWLQVLLDAENMFIATHDLLDADEDIYEDEDDDTYDDEDDWVYEGDI